MIILIDTNIILDCLIPRQPFEDNANKILQLCFEQKCTGYIAALSVTNIFYILRNQFSEIERKKLLLNLCEFIEIAGIQKKLVLDALKNDKLNDLEDCLQIECAGIVKAEYIVTRNIVDFKNSPIPAVLPEEFIKKMMKQ